MSLRERKKQQVREEILEVCGKLFRSQGFDETTVPDIIEKVGISRQTFFNYFPGKEAVLTELGLSWLRQQAQVPRDGLESAQPGSIMTGTREAIRAQLKAIEADANFMRLVFTRSGLLFPQSATIGELPESVKQDHTRAVFTAVANILAAAKHAGELRADVEPLQAAEMIIGVMLMTIRLWLIGYWNGKEGLEARGMRALALLEQGIAAP